jgi:hypothetical protein
MEYFRQQNLQTHRVYHKIKSLRFFLPVSASNYNLLIQLILDINSKLFNLMKFHLIRDNSIILVWF